MPSDRLTAAALRVALVVCMLVAAGVTATADVTVGKSPTVAGPQDAAASEAALALDRPSRRMIQQGLRNEGFDPGPPDGLFGPRTRAAIRDWQQSRGASPTGYVTRAEAGLLRSSAGLPPAAAPPAVTPTTSFVVERLNVTFFAPSSTVLTAERC